MTRIRVFILISTIIIVGSLSTIFYFYAKGFRFSVKTGKVSPNGLLVIKSHPDSAKVYINAELKTATNATIPLPPGNYDISIKKEGYITWNKRLTIEAGVVTESTAHLFKQVPSLTAITTSGVLNPVPSSDFTKLAYIVPPQNDIEDSEGLWIIENLNLPIGFTREPKRITDGNLTQADLIWSPDSSEILLSLGKSAYLLKTNVFTPQSQRINIATQKEEILKKWDDKKEIKNTSQIRKLPEEVQDLLKWKVSSFVFSADENMVLYTASSSATLRQNLIPELPGASTQKEERNIKPYHTYIYDIKEDRNFLIDTDGKNLLIEGGSPSGTISRRIIWFPTSRHVILAEPNKVVIMDYDGTNRQVIYQGIYTSPHTYPTLSLDRLIILTNLGANNSPPNLYSLEIK